jgi:hypothetical protein
MNSAVRRLLSDLDAPNVLVAIHDPLGVAWSERQALAATITPIRWENPLAGRAAYEPLREQKALAVFYHDRIPPDIEARVEHRLDARISALYHCHSAIDNLVTPTLLEAHPSLETTLLDQTERSASLVAFARAIYELPAIAPELYRRLESLHNESNGWDLPTDHIEAVLLALEPLKATDVELETLLDPDGFESFKTLVFQASLNASLGKSQSSQAMLDLAYAVQSAGGTRVRAGVIAEARLVDEPKRLAMLRETNNVQLERALAYVTLESQLSTRAPSQILTDVVGILKKKARKYNEVKQLEAADLLLRGLYQTIPSIDAPPEDWLKLGMSRAKLEQHLAVLSTDHRGMLQKLYSETMWKWDTEFAHYLRKQYPTWMRGTPRPAITSADVLEHFVDPNVPTYLLVLDGMALDQWEAICAMVLKAYGTRRQPKVTPYFSLLPSATPYARNALFAGLTPAQIAAKFGTAFLDGNNFEEKLLKNRFPDAIYVRGAGDVSKEGREKRAFAKSAISNLKAFVFNTIDDLIHAKNLGNDRPSAIRLIKAAFEESPLTDILENAGREHARVLITSDHGNQITNRPAKFQINSFDEFYSPKARYVTWSRGIKVKDHGNTLMPESPEDWGLPNDIQYAVCVGDARVSGGQGPYLAHGGISLLECVIPMVVIE